MLFGLDGVEIGLIIVFLTLFSAILSGFPVAFAIGGAGVISFAIIAALDSAGLLIHQAMDKDSAEYAAFQREIVDRRNITMVEEAEKYLQQGGAFIAVGALHLPGEAGMLNILAQKGYSISRISD